MYVDDTWEGHNACQSCEMHQEQYVAVGTPLAPLLWIAISIFTIEVE